MIKRFKNRVLHRLQLRESWIIFFIAGIIMMNFPFLQIFNRAELVFGIPLLFLYYTLGWAVSIFVIYLFTRAVNGTSDKQTERRKS